MHKTFLVIPTLIAVALLAAGCGGANGAEEPTPEETVRRNVRIETLVVEPTTFEDIIELTGSVSTDDDATLSAQTLGTVEFLAPLGRHVAGGAPVARLNQDLARAALEQFEAQLQNAEAQLELAQDNFDRQEPLFRDSIVSALEFQNVRTQRNQAQAALRSAQALRDQGAKQLANTTITAPFAGTVEEHFVQEGEQISIGQPVARVVNTQRVNVTVGVPERYSGDISVGTGVRIDFKAYGQNTREGTVTFVGSAINPDNRTFPIEIELSNQDGTLKPEMIARVNVTRERLEGVLVVPRTAVIRDENGTAVYVVDKDGTPSALRREVVLGPAYGDRVIVSNGLETGDEVIVLGQNTVTDGDAVDVVQQYRDLDSKGVPVE